MCVFEQRNPLQKKCLRFLNFFKSKHTRLWPGDAQDSITDNVFTKLLSPSWWACISSLPLPFYCTICAFWSFVSVFVFCVWPEQLLQHKPVLGEGQRRSRVEGDGFKKMEEHALEGHSETGQLKTVPFCCLFFPCQDLFLPRYFTLCLSQNSLSIGWTTNGVSNSCTTVCVTLWRVAWRTLRLLHFFVYFFSRHFRSFWSWQKQFWDEESRECTTGSTCEVFFLSSFVEKEC